MSLPFRPVAGATSVVLFLLAPAAPAAPTLGGYGELHANQWSNAKANGTDVREIDFHRFVLFFGNRFSDRIRLYAELELEHAFLKDSDTDTDTAAGSSPKTAPSAGEIELEQAFLEFGLTDHLTAKGGIFLIPVGLINETHEPPTFYGVERNPVEGKIIPGTWWAGGAALHGAFDGGFDWDLAVHEGLNLSSAKTFAVRDGRQKTAKAVANDLAVTGRLRWKVPGVELGASVQHQGDMAQDTDPTVGAGRLGEAHVALERGILGFKALYATWRIDGSGPEAKGADTQSGWYVEPSVRPSPEWGVFMRYNTWDNQAGDAVNSRYRQTDVGVNFWPHPDVVIKLDYMTQQAPTGKDQYDGFNVGIGYQF